jgi:hypothetical protein
MCPPLIIAAVVAVAGAAAKAGSDKKAADATSAQAMATHSSNQAAQISRAYAGSIRATTANPSAFFDAARAGGMTDGSGGGMGGGGLGSRAVGSSEPPQTVG